MTADRDRPFDPSAPDDGAGFDFEFYHGPRPDPRSQSKFAWGPGDFVIGSLEDANEWLGLDPEGRPYITPLTPKEMEAIDREFGEDASSDT